MKICPVKQNFKTLGGQYKNQYNTKDFTEKKQINNAFELTSNEAHYLGLQIVFGKNVYASKNVKKTLELSDEQIDSFHNALQSLSKHLALLSDEEFNNLTIRQEYGKDDFIKDVLPYENTYRYFKFIIEENENSKLGYSMTGFPINPEHKKEVLGELVDRFNTNNKISCSNKDIEKELNTMVEILPELRTMIDRVQAGNLDENGKKIGQGAHCFDVFKHSLKVMQKLFKHPNTII